MKELSIEEKAKAYDEALKIARQYYNDRVMPIGTNFKLEKMFPELVESEEERIRKSLKILLQHFCKGYRVPGLDFPVSYKDMLAWLEKQGQTFTQKDVDDAYLKGICDAKQELEKQGEQKPTDKVESKFKIGDWVVCDSDIDRVERVTNRFYHFESGDCGLIKYIDNDCHLWTIQDAKPGDILATEPIQEEHTNSFVVIFKERGLNFFNSYCFVSFDGKFIQGTTGHSINVHPATKEQRDLLFQKMRKAGYEWNADTKVLKEIEPTFDIEIPFGAKDSELEEVSYSIPNGYHAEIEDNKVVIKKGEQKSAWTEEDNVFCDGIISHFKKELGNGTIEAECSDKQVISDLKYCYKRNINWLKSLKERYTWKPSNEQMKALWNVYRGGKEQAELATLYNDLNKLRENSYETTDKRTSDYIRRKQVL